MTTFSKPSHFNVNEFAVQLGDADNFELGLLTTVVTVAQTELRYLHKLNDELLHVLKKEEQNRSHYLRTKENAQRQRDSSQTPLPDLGANHVPNSPQPTEVGSTNDRFTPWEEICDSIPDRIFRKKYRMTKEQFHLFCTKIRTSIGDKRFRPKNSQALCGYTRVAIGLCILCGGSYLDLIGRAYDVGATSGVYKYFHTLVDWVNETFGFPWVDILKAIKEGDLSGISKLKQLTTEFSLDSDGYFSGCIGAIDGLAIRLKCPSNTKDPGNYFCRKNFYALNVQAICDRYKRILWISPGHQGATHDSTAWSQTGLSTVLESITDILKAHGLFIVGDTAYPISAHLLVPYPQAQPGTQEDAFNFWLSNSRIHIECTFGEFIARFGLFWRTLKFDIKRSCDIIKSAALIHNFLIDCREGDDFLRHMTYQDVVTMDQPG